MVATGAPADADQLGPEGSPAPALTIEQRFLTHIITLDEAVDETLPEWVAPLGTKSDSLANRAAKEAIGRAREHIRRQLMRLAELQQQAEAKLLLEEKQAKEITQLTERVRQQDGTISELGIDLDRAARAAQERLEFEGRAITAAAKVAVALGVAPEGAYVGEESIDFWLGASQVVIATPAGQDRSVKLTTKGRVWTCPLVREGIEALDVTAIRRTFGPKGELIIPCLLGCEWPQCQHRRKQERELLSGPSGRLIQQHLDAGHTVQVALVTSMPFIGFYLTGGRDGF
jgi:hypothetical protein